MPLTLAMGQLWASSLEKKEIPQNCSCGKPPQPQKKAARPGPPGFCWGLSSQSPSGASLGSGMGLSSCYSSAFPPGTLKRCVITGCSWGIWDFWSSSFPEGTGLKPHDRAEKPAATGSVAEHPWGWGRGWAMGAVGHPVAPCPWDWEPAGKPSLRHR